MPDGKDYADLLKLIAEQGRQPKLPTLPTWAETYLDGLTEELNKKYKAGEMSLVQMQGIYDQAKAQLNAGEQNIYNLPFGEWIDDVSSRPMAPEDTMSYPAPYRGGAGGGMYPPIEPSYSRPITEADIAYREQRAIAESGGFMPQTDFPDFNIREMFTPALPGAEETAYPFLERMATSPAMKQYLQRQRGDIVGRAAKDVGAARQAWWSRITQPMDEGISQAAKERAYGIGTGMPTGEIFGHMRTAATSPIRPEMTTEGTYRGDPLIQYLQSFPAEEEFLGTPPRQRGYFPSRLAPPTSWGRA